MDPKDWYTNEMPRKVYADSIQEGVRRILGRSLVRTFALFKYKKHSLVNVYCATFDAPHEAKIREVIDIVEYKFTQHEKTMNNIIKNLADQGKNAEAEWMTNCVDILVKNFACMSSALLARQILDTTHSFHVNKNWNSHGSQVGAAMCQLGSILLSFEDASNQRLVSTYFSEVIPRGCLQTGAKHGNQDVTYVEYMCSAIEKQLVIGGKELYLNHIKFVKDNHAEKIRKIFDEKMANIDAPVPCPPWAHTCNFNCTYMGVHLIDGECKGDSKPDSKSAASVVLVLHSAEQLAYKQSALSILTTNESITFFDAFKDCDTKRIHVTFHELPKYNLEPVQDIEKDLDKTLPELADPPKYCILSKNGGFINEYEEGLQYIVDTWKKMRLELKKMVLAILHAVDIIAEYLLSVDIEEAATKRKQSYDRGFIEPFFLTTSERDLKSKRPILSPEKFVYCTRMMEGAMTPDELSEFNKMMFNYY